MNKKDKNIAEAITSSYLAELRESNQKHVIGTSEYFHTLNNRIKEALDNKRKK